MSSDDQEKLLSEIKARVDKVTIDGIARTKDDVIGKILANQFKDLSLIHI